MRETNYPRMDTTGNATDSRTASAHEPTVNAVEVERPGFTPGPWRVAPESFDATQRIIASVDRRYGFIANTLHGNDEANAHLIAAAPDLYDSVREFVALYAGLDDAIGGSVKAKLARARAALAKADGRDEGSR